MTDDQFPYSTVALPDGVVIGGPWPNTIITWPGGKSRGATKPEYDLFQALEKANAKQTIVDADIIAYGNGAVTSTSAKRIEEAMQKHNPLWTQQEPPSDRGPVTRTLSQDEATKFVLQWMREHYADLKNENQDRYCEKLGLILDCVSDMIEQR